jgi:hypothetical protein
MPFENGWMPLFIPGWGGKSSREEGSGKINAECAEDAEFAEKRRQEGGLKPPLHLVCCGA